MTPEQILQKYWGYNNFRLSQKEVVESILLGHDTLALLPTGGGKSVCYQVPGLLFPGKTLVISPLISLMKDQVDGLISRGIAATYVASTLSKEEQEKRLNQIQQDNCKFIYVSPEKLKNKKFTALLSSLHISLIVIDESHCVSLWGGDFRPTYLEIPLFVSRISPRPVVTALTATATPSTKQEIVNGLHLHNPAIFQSSFKRNIAISIVKTTSITEHELQLFAYLKNNKKPGIIYASSRDETERLSSRLNCFAHLLDIDNVGCYHAGLSAEQRQTTQQFFLENKLQLLVATTAFGMGIDKPNIEFITHYHPPATLEGYFQEIGRAGRSGQHASALQLFFPKHLAIHYGLLNKSLTKKPKKMFEDVKHFLNSKCCRMQSLLCYFGEKSEKCGMCDVCSTRPSPLQKCASNNQDFLVELLKWRNTVAQKWRIEPEMVLHPQQLAYLLVLHPQTIDDLKTIPGCGHGWLKFWGESYLGVK